MVHLAATLIWQFGDFGFDRQFYCVAILIIIMCIMSISKTIYSQYHPYRQTKFHQSALHSNLPNLMSTKYPTYAVHCYKAIISNFEEIFQNINLIKFNFAAKVSSVVVPYVWNINTCKLQTFLF